MLKFSFLCAAVFLAVSSSCQAGFLLHSSDNCSAGEVLTAITAYNLTHEPDLQTVFSPFLVKTDDSGGFGTLVANGFQFFSHPSGTPLITSAGALHSEAPAYFSYSGAASLLYYTVKAGSGFDLFLYEPGVSNFLHSGSPAISHVSFFTGLRLPEEGPELPEPASAVLLLLGVAGAAGGRRLMRPKNSAIES
jgi:hypothetical protein